MFLEIFFSKFFIYEKQFQKLTVQLNKFEIDFSQLYPEFNYYKINSF